MRSLSQYHLKISAAWPIPIHYGCHCSQVKIKPEKRPRKPFCDYRELLNKMPPDQQRAAIGASELQAAEVRPGHLGGHRHPEPGPRFPGGRGQKPLTVDQMVKHGVKPARGQASLLPLSTPPNTNTSNASGKSCSRN